MPQLNECREMFKGRKATVVGAGLTSVDYAELAQTTDIVIFINWALGASVHFTRPEHKLFFFSWHIDLFQARPEFYNPRMVVCLPGYFSHHISEECCQRAIWYMPVNVRPFVAYTRLLTAYMQYGRIMLDANFGEIPSCGNTTLLALMFLWYTGVVEIDCVGMHDVSKGSNPLYDPRLKAGKGPIDPYYYKRDLETFCELMDIKYNYLA